MAKYNVTNLFDGMFAKTASRLMSKSGLGSKVSRGSAWCTYRWEVRVGMSTIWCRGDV